MADTDSKHRRCRTPNYTPSEKNFLTSFIEKHRAVIDCKRTDALSNELKDAVWIQLTDEFNSVTRTERTKRQLQIWWENQKGQKHRKPVMNNLKKDNLMMKSSEDACNWSCYMWDAHVPNTTGTGSLSEYAALPRENCYVHCESEEASAAKKKQRMARGQNWSDSEKNILIGLIEKHKAVIECKRTDSSSNKIKDEVWSQLTDEFNSLTGTARTTYQLRVWWGNQKNRLRRCLTNNKLNNNQVLSAGGDSWNWSTDFWDERFAAIAGFSLKSECESVCSGSHYRSVDDAQADCSRESVVPLLFDDISPALLPSKTSYKSTEHSSIDADCSIEQLQSVDNLSVHASTATVEPLASDSESRILSNLRATDTTMDLEIDLTVPNTSRSVECVEKSAVENVRFDLLTEQLETIKNNKELLMKECNDLCIVRWRVWQWLEEIDKRQVALEAQIAEQESQQKLVEEQISQEHNNDTTFVKTQLIESNLKLGSRKFKATSVRDVDDSVEECPQIGETDDVTIGDYNTALGSTHKSRVKNISKTFHDEVIFDKCIPDMMVTAQNSVAAVELPRSFLCDLCGAVFTNSSSWAYHQSSHRGKSHICTECNKQFSYANQLEQHYRLHTGQRPFLCQQCGRSFHKKRLLVLHSRTHSSELTVKCMHCSAAFKRRSSLRRHIAFVHEPDRLFSCSRCHLRFDEQCRLRDHERTHSGDLPFECAICKKRYCSKHSLNNHKLYAHRPKKTTLINNDA